MHNAHELDIREMLDLVSQSMKYYESEWGTKQSCSYEVRHFYKKLFFNPGIALNESIQVPTKSAANQRAASPGRFADVVDSVRSRMKRIQVNPERDQPDGAMTSSKTTVTSSSESSTKQKEEATSHTFTYSSESKSGTGRF